MKPFAPALLVAALAFPVLAQTLGAPPGSRPAAQQAAVACEALMSKTSQGEGAVPFKRLDELPPGVLEHAVLRTVAGCPVREIRYEGRTYYVSPSIPRIQPLMPATPK